MVTRTAFSSLAAAVALAGCGGVSPVANQPMATPRDIALAPPAAPRNAADPAGTALGGTMALDPQGLRAVEAELGTAGLLAFGSSADLAVEAVRHILGAAPAEDAVMTTCGPAATRVVRWAQGFTLLARNGRFAGWQVERPVSAFANGIGVGSTLRELGQAFPVSVTRRGDDIVFAVTTPDIAVGGVLAGTRGDARILSLSAGATCDPQAQPPAPAPAATGNAAAARRR